ncbi:hypothetical protein [Streptomyces sp. MH60]|uniref:hypothetical protein n=1 Tax=Streptomyces sp. MH60 TaxID=1940758 RepID=UPI000CEF12BB|nr:hypothetical protein [Streptomyces sp. MH60]PPS89409.1 hypothetical protein BZZ08_01555 [Streptomyces sp. MH60]
MTDDDETVNEQAVVAYLARLPDDPAALAAKAAEQEARLAYWLAQARTYSYRMDRCTTIEARRRNARRAGVSLQHAQTAREWLEAIRRRTEERS